MRFRKAFLVLFVSVLLLGSCRSNKSLDYLFKKVEKSEAVIEKWQKSVITERISWDSSWQYANESKIHSDSAIHYKRSPSKGTILLNAGHGTVDGSSVMTYCHPDHSKKVTGGSSKEGAIKVPAIAVGATMADGTPESEATLNLSILVKEELLKKGYSVIMIRDKQQKTAQLDNIARTVIGNEHADVHLSLHYDSSMTDKGAFVCSVPKNDTYRQMEPVAEMDSSHEEFGANMIKALKKHGIKLYGEGEVPTDLTQTSYSKIPSCVLEVGDKVSDRSPERLRVKASAIAEGVELYFRGMRK